jgi:hypothetical protein
LALSVSADELRIARFDVQRVFDEYQHTKDLKAATLSKINVGGPGSYTPSMERRDKLKASVDTLTERLKAATAGTPEQERLELQLQIATLELQLDELRRTLESTQRERTQVDDAWRQRAQLLGEIFSAASRLCTERGYQVLAPDNLPSDGSVLSFVVTGTSDDLTEPLLARLNQEYAAKKSK